MNRQYLYFILVLCLFSLPLQAQKTGVSLSGGAALGYAHLGFLQAMDEAGIRPDCICGTSMGAIMGMFYAAGYKPQEIKEIAKKEHMDRIYGLSRFSLKHKGGLLNTRHIEKILRKYIPHNNFDSLPIRFYCCTSDMNHLKAIYKGSGDSLISYVVASAAVPGIFAPIQIDGAYCMDGGIHDNLPALPLIAEQCEVRIASLLLTEQASDNKKLKNLWMHAYSYSGYATGLAQLDKFTDIVRIDPGGYWLTDFRKIEELYDIGYRTGKAYFESHRK